MNRREFCISSSAAFLSSAAVSPLHANASAPDVPTQFFDWKTPELTLHFSVAGGRLRQHLLFPTGMVSEHNNDGGGAEVALQCSNEDAIDSGAKQAAGLPGNRLLFVEKQETTHARGTGLILRQKDSVLGLEVESIYDAFAGSPILRRRTRITNRSDKAVGIEFLSSAMLHGLANGQRFDEELRLHYAVNSWMAEAQWQEISPSMMGFVENERTSWSAATATSVGTWSSERYIPMAVLRNQALGVSWFWQIEHNGSWHWELSNTASRGNRADNVYAYLGGPDALHAQAWKNLQPGQSYETVPVALGVVRGGFTESIDALTRYRRTQCAQPRQAKTPFPVVFNDYMNCLVGDPTEEKELPLIAAAAEVGCEYYVIDAGWYAERNENWGETVGAWQPSKTRWPRGLKFTLDQIRSKGMIPGLWLEPEVAGRHSPLATKPDSWFMMRHGQRLIRNSRLQLDLRNPDVRKYLDEVVDRCVLQYGAGYLKFDYNTTSLEGTETNADSLGQGLLEHNRAHLRWLQGLLDRHTDLVIENCGSGGGRMDYAMLSRLQLQSVSDQEEYLRFPAIVTGASAAVIPEQMAIWSYPVEDATGDAASFNMVNALLGRIHQSGHLARIAPAARQQVKTAIELYKSTIRPTLSSALPFYPLGLPKIVDHHSPVALGMKSDHATFVAVWRLDGKDEVHLPLSQTSARLLYPLDLNISSTRTAAGITVKFPRPRMAAILQLNC